MVAWQYQNTHYAKYESRWFWGNILHMCLCSKFHVSPYRWPVREHVREVREDIMPEDLTWTETSPTTSNRTIKSPNQKLSLSKSGSAKFSLSSLVTFMEEPWWPAILSTTPPTLSLVQFCQHLLWLLMMMFSNTWLEFTVSTMAVCLQGRLVKWEHLSLRMVQPMGLHGIH